MWPACRVLPSRPADAKQRANGVWGYLQMARRAGKQAGKHRPRVQHSAERGETTRTLAVMETTTTKPASPLLRTCEEVRGNVRRPGERPVGKRTPRNQPQDHRSMKLRHSLPAKTSADRNPRGLLKPGLPILRPPSRTSVWGHQEGWHPRRSRERVHAPSGTVLLEAERGNPRAWPHTGSTTSVQVDVQRTQGRLLPASNPCPRRTTTHSEQHSSGLSRRDSCPTWTIECHIGPSPSFVSDKALPDTAQGSGLEPRASPLSLTRRRRKARAPMSGRSRGALLE